VKIGTDLLDESSPAIIKTRPILKWAGGKHQLLPQLLPKIPAHPAPHRYIEPFFGGGALFFALQPQNAVISDSNPDLINVYQTVAADVSGVINQLKRLLKEFPLSKESFYSVRAMDIKGLSKTRKAARILYLNKTCFNGLYRVNSDGRFNVPYGNYKNPQVCREPELRAASLLLQQAVIRESDYKNTLRCYAREGDLVFLDPPYLPVSKYADFKRYTREQFYEEDHHELADEVSRLHELGCHVILTHSNHPLIYELYDGFQIEVFSTRRNINKKSAGRTGEDVIITIPPKRRLMIQLEPPPMVRQVKKYPVTRYMGSKQAILPHIQQAASEFQFDSACDLFSGSGIVGYMFKAMGKQVFANDFMTMNSTYTCAMIENNDVTLDDSDLSRLLNRDVETDGFVFQTFQGLYYSDEENRLIDCIRFNIKKLKNKYKRALAMSALMRAALKKRPRGIFTYTGDRYNDGRKDLKLSFLEQFKLALKGVNNAVFDNHRKNISRCGDALSTQWKPDLVYMDPPYYSPYSDNDYVRRYHFLEGLARDWQEVEIQRHTKTKKFKSYPSPFNSRAGAHDAFDKLFQHFEESILLVSYSSNSLPGKEEILSLMSKYKKHVEVVSVNHRYSFANQGRNVNSNKNKVQEYIFAGY